MKIVKLKPKKESNKNESGDLVIERLKEALAMAEDGLIENVLVLAVLNDGGVMDCWANTGKLFTVVGGLESLKKEFMDRCIDGR